MPPGLTGADGERGAADPTPIRGVIGKSAVS